MDTMAHLTHSDGLCIQLTRRDYSAWATRRVEDSRRGGAGAGARTWQTRALEAAARAPGPPPPLPSCVASGTLPQFSPVKRDQ